MSIRHRFERLSEECQKGALQTGSLLTGYSERDEDRLDIVKEVIGSPEGLALPILLRRVFGHESSSGPQANTDYKFLERFLTNHPEYFRVTKPQNGENRVTEATFTLELFDLILQGIRQKNQNENVCHDKDFCEKMLRSSVRLTHNTMEILSDELTSYISRTKDYRIIYDMVLETGDPTSFIVPYRTRFNSSQRANRSLGQFYDVMETAALNYDTAVLVTLTTDPAKHESLWDAIQAIGQNFTRLQQWLAYEPKNKESTRPGRRLPFVKVLEFTGGSRESTYPGLPHLHVLFFDVDRRSDGMPFLMDKQELASKWDDLGQGRIVQLTPFCFETDLNEDVYGTDNGFVCWGSNDERTDDQDFERSTTAERYLSKYIGQLSALASEADEIGSGSGIPDNSQLELYKLAMYWVTGRQVWSCSNSLRESDETPISREHTQTAEVTVTFAGCYHKDDIPVSTLLNSRQVNPIETRRMGDGSYQWLVSEEVIGTG